MKRFLSFIMAASLLTLAACKEDPSQEAPVITPVFPETEQSGVAAEGAPFTFTVSPVPNMDWTVTIPESEFFSLSGETTPRYSISGLANTDAVIKVYATANVPTETKTCNVTLTMDGKSKQIATVTRMGVEPVSLLVYPALRDSYEDTDELFKKDSNGQFLYSDTPVTTLTMIADDYGEKALQQRFKVVSESDWIITQAPLWMYGVTTDTNGRAGARELFALTDDTLQPFKETTEQLVFSQDTEASDAKVLATIDVIVPGCGNFVSANWDKEVLFNASGMLYNENAGGFVDYTAVAIYAGYGSQIFFVSKDGWIRFEEEVHFSTEDYSGNDLTVRGIQYAIGMVNCDFNDDEERTGYLVGIPVNKVQEGFSKEKALNADGTLAKDYEQFILCTITQIAAPPSDSNALVKWAWDESELGGLNRDEFATIETISPANTDDSRTKFFTGECVTAPVGYEVHYSCLEAESVAALTVTDYASVEVYTAIGPWAEEQMNPQWVKWDDSNKSAITIKPQYDFNNDQWKVEPYEYEEEEYPNYYSAFFVLKNNEGKVITWILFTLDPKHYEAGSEKAA